MTDGGFPSCLRVMADYGSSGIWVAERRGIFRHGMTSYAALRLPKPLAARFEAWISDYWNRIDDPDAFDVNAFNERGRTLARELKAHVGSQTRVVFAPERRDGRMAEEEDVDLCCG